LTTWDLVHDDDPGPYLGHAQGLQTKKIFLVPTPSLSQIYNKSCLSWMAFLDVIYADVKINFYSLILVFPITEFPKGHERSWALAWALGLRFILK
jgi:hypothetical protein